jgi:hypothetical protein
MGPLFQVKCKPDNRRLMCQTEVDKKEWEMETQIIFTPEGLTSVVTNKKANVSMKVFYKRMADPWLAKRKKLLLMRNLM